MEVLLPERNELDDHLDRVDNGEDEVEDLEHVNERLVHAEPGKSEDERVEADADEDEDLEGGVLGDLCHL